MNLEMECTVLILASWMNHHQQQEKQVLLSKFVNNVKMKINEYILTRKSLAIPNLYQFYNIKYRVLKS